jgi:hypothetical protein
VTILPILAKWYLIFEDFIKKRTAAEYAAVHKKAKSRPARKRTTSGAT